MARRALREEPAAPALCYLKTGAVVARQEPIPTAHVSCKWASGVMHAAVKRLRPLAYKPLPLGTVRPTGIPTTTKAVVLDVFLTVQRPLIVCSGIHVVGKST